MWEEGNKERVTQECIGTRKTSIAYFLSCEEYGCVRDRETEVGETEEDFLRFGRGSTKVKREDETMRRQI